ncbi:glutamate 5-kinase [uncultured Cohaesibacter sp.]|uniref:glutamate 5-kinase n=1 Tax=uncultured Cohaesibacter sp. TaxID=1002546 RepID=UPI00292FE4C7|nr:glutamate 5-kinase [uncultured Cohaesibacter sp.]
MRLEDQKRIVVKIGSATLVDQATGRLRAAWLQTLIDDIAMLKEQGKEVIIVSSGAIALGRRKTELPPGKLRLEESQAAAAIGQIALGEAYSDALHKVDLTAGQVLLTLSDTEERRRYLNARATLTTLLKLGAVPIINENDTVATSEIKFGDNDRLAARVATMISADCLILLSDIDGLYTAPPLDNPDAKHIPVIEQITHDIEAMAGSAGSSLAKGGMTTKIAAAKIAVNAGTAMIIADGSDYNPLNAIMKGAKHSWFVPNSTPIKQRKRWINGHLEPHGTLMLDKGAVNALLSGKSLLPAGVKKLGGDFAKGDAVIITDLDGEEIARGLIGYDRSEADQIMGCKSTLIPDILGYDGRPELVHRDDMVLSGSDHVDH